MGCPEENQVADFVRGELDREARGEIERHIDGCPACCRVVGDLARIFEEPVEGIESLEGVSETLQTEPAGGEPSARLGNAYLPDGSRLGRYVVLSRVGAGGMGVVFAAYDPELDRKVAIKLMRTAPGGSGSKAMSDLRTRLLREAQAMAKLSHPNVITVHDVGTFEGQVFVAMEFIDGSTLAQWLGERRRSWREVLQVLLPAGRGLAAAHAAGLVHRDFKPDNVLLGRDGRVLVTDFGLARPAAGNTDAFASADSLVGGSRALGLTLTQTGALVGTPAYMAPEQLAGGRPDACSDQFSYCVAVYEGLYGHRPFPGRVLSELIASVSEGRVRSAPRESSVPRWLRRALLVGLSIDPTDRYPSMVELLAELVRNPYHPWRQVAALALPAVVATAAVAAYEREELGVTPYCQDVAEQLENVWDEARQEQLDEVITNGGKPYAATTIEALHRRLDPYAAQWLSMQSQACRDEVEGARPPAVLVLQMTCLDRRRDALRAATDVLLAGGEQTIENAIEIAENLPAIEICGDLDALIARERSRDDVDPDQAREIDAALTRAKVLGEAGDFRAAAIEARAVVARANAIGYASAEAEALLTDATTTELLGDVAAAEAGYHQALSSALASASSETLVGASLRLVWVTGARSRQLVEASRWYAHGKGALDRMGGDPDLGSELERAIGSAYLEHGDLERAEQHVREALRIREEAFGPQHVSIGSSLGTLGGVLMAKGSWTEARAAFERALELTLAEYGRGHPNAAAALNSMGIVMSELGDKRAAKTHLEQALAICEAALTPEHPTCNLMRHNVASVLADVGEHDAGLRIARRVLEIAERIDPTEVASAHASLGVLLETAGRHEAASVEFQRAIDMAIAQFGESSPTVAIYQHNAAGTMMSLGRHDEALRLVQAALATRERALGPEHPRVASSYVRLAEIQLARGELNEAKAAADRGLAMREGEPDPTLRAEARFVSGRVRWALASDDAGRQAGRDDVEQAIATGGNDTAKLAEMRDWLGQHPASRPRRAVQP